MDILLRNRGVGKFDISFSKGDIELSPTLYSMVVVSLFADGRANEQNYPYEVPTDRRGWWGDAEIGSVLWAFRREKITAELLANMESASLNALNWLIVAGIAGDIQVTATRNGLETISLAVAVTRSNGEVENMEFDNLWNEV